ncbi:hypothetical protein [Nostoc sp.]|uniref:hypothetical protein n=1 Tax=Nostoc sp. TaxID=1180 RepID=UPI002FF37F9E
MTDLIYPTIDLFLFDLKYSLGDTEEELERYKETFLKKLPKDVDKSGLKIKNDSDNEYFHLLDSTYQLIKPKDESYEVYFYPVQLGDSYGLLMHCSINNKTDAQPANSFASIKLELEQILNNETATIGQTWMLSGWLSPNQTKSQEEIAQACYQALLSGCDWERDLEGQGQFLGATIFELTYNNQHIIIVIYPDENTSEHIANKFYSDWMRLFYFRHKISWAYSQSQVLKNSLQGVFRTIKVSNDDIAEDRRKGDELNALYERLVYVQNTLNAYTADLAILDFQGGTIDINLSNYEKRLHTIEEKADKSKPGAQTELRFFRKFSELVKDKYRLQVTKDSENLERGSKILSYKINVVRSQVEAEKVRRDKDFQNFVTFLSGGWAFGSFITALPGLDKNNDNPVRSYLIKSFHINVSTQPATQQETWWLIPATKGIYTLGGFITAILVLLIWRHFWRQYRSPLKEEIIQKSISN